MPTPSRGAATNRPDTNARAVLALREAAFRASAFASAVREVTGDEMHEPFAAECRALADAIEQTPVSNTPLWGALTKAVEAVELGITESADSFTTRLEGPLGDLYDYGRTIGEYRATAPLPATPWQERVERAQEERIAVGIGTELDGLVVTSRQIESILRAAFPELAPSDD